MLDGTELALAFTPAEAHDAFAMLAAGSGFRLFAQRGRGLGERLQNIFADTLANGYQAVTVIDSDSPDLPKSTVRESFRLLLSGRADAVFGPSFDGGYYLVGLRRPQPELFENISWSTATVLEATLAKARAIGLKTELLAWWNDLDTCADLIDFYNKYRDKRECKGLRGEKTLSFLATLNKIHRPSTVPEQEGQEESC